MTATKVAYMETIRINNDSLEADISMHGAELKRLVSAGNMRNYIYDGSGPWKRSAPVLFPNIGGLAGEKYVYCGEEYPALPHGFARDMEFVVTEHSRDKVKLLLENNTESEKYFPFRFSLSISYELRGSNLKVDWEVVNEDSKTMYFSIGAHPGFALLSESSLDDYYLIFDRDIRLESRRVIGRYLTEEKELIHEMTSSIRLSAELLRDDAIILEDTGVSRLDLICDKQQYHLWMEFPDFPVVALWTDPHSVNNAEFICLEPWCGINSYCNEDAKEISLKDRINKLNSGYVFKRTYTIGIEE